jgi:predicted AAA+ superfamily ATPase
MYRFALEKLLAWKNSSDRKPLIVNGARQVGKTYLIKEFAKDNYAKVAYISFNSDEIMSQSFKKDFDVQRIITEIGIFCNLKIIPRDTVIILDEIQDCPEALSSLKYFCEEARAYHVIAAGSLLGVTMHQGLGFPVGKIDQINLKPMSFSEFLLASNQEKYLNLISQPPTA